MAVLELKNCQCKSTYQVLIFHQVNSSPTSYQLEVERQNEMKFGERKAGGVVRIIRQKDDDKLQSTI
jgi:hypothetical protein